MTEISLYIITVVNRDVSSCIIGNAVSTSFDECFDRAVDITTGLTFVSGKPRLPQFDDVKESLSDCGKWQEDVGEGWEYKLTEKLIDAAIILE